MEQGVIEILRKHGCLYMKDDYKALFEELEAYYKPTEALKNNAVLPRVSKRCSHCLYRKYRPNAKHRYETNQCQISGHNLIDVENHSCKHYKPIPNVC